MVHKLQSTRRRAATQQPTRSTSVATMVNKVRDDYFVVVAAMLTKFEREAAEAKRRTKSLPTTFGPKGRHQGPPSNNFQALMEVPASYLVPGSGRSYAASNKQDPRYV